jgi:hypothetical protein
MLSTIPIEEIGALRRQLGIEDIELHAQVGRLRVGDLVRLTFLPAEPTGPGETLDVRITSIRYDRYRGRLVGRPVRVALARLRPGVLIGFTEGQIHSVTAPRPA